MPLINTALPNLIGGVSQQPDVTRFEGQCEEQENALSSVVDGLTKRPPAEFVEELESSSAIGSDSFVHFIDRSEEEKYCVYHTGTTLKAYNVITGAACTINGVSSLNTTHAAYSYINSNNPKEDLKGLSIGDTTFLLNTKKRVSKLSTKSPAATRESFAYVAQGDYEKLYALRLKAYSGGSSSNNTYEFPNLVYLQLNWTHTPSQSFYYDGGTAGSIGRIYNSKYYYKKDSYKLSSVTFTQEAFDLATPESFTISSLGVGSATTSTNPFEMDSSYPLLSQANIITAPEIEFSTDSNGYLVCTVTNQGNIEVTGRGSTTGDINSVESGHANSIAGVFQAFNTLASVELNTTTNSSFNVAATNTGNLFFSRPIITTNVHSHLSSGLTLGVRSGVAVSSSTQTAKNADTNKIATDIFNKSTIPYTLGNGAPNGETYISDTDNGLGLSGTAALLRNSGTRWQTYTTLTRYDNIIKIDPLVSSGEWGNGIDYNLEIFDGLQGEGFKAVYKNVASITDLPKKSLNNFRVKVSGDEASDQDDYYVKFKTDNDAEFGTGSYIEDIGYNVHTSLDASTLPHQLRLTGLNQFVFEAANYETRDVGDDISNPFPTFTDNFISNIFLFKDRLGFLSGDKVVLSEAGLGLVENGQVQYNFFRTTVKTLLDSDPIDLTVSSDKVINLTAAKGFQENLILFAENGQFALKGGDILTQKTVSVAPITNFNYSNLVDPIVLGSYIYFPFEKGSHSGFREFAVNATTDNYDAEEITEHVPTYIPSDVSSIAGSSTEDLLVAFAPSTPNTLYFYKYFWSGTRKLVSSWFKCTYPFDIRGLDIVKSMLYIVGVKDGTTALYKTHLETQPVSITSPKYLIDGLIKHTGTSATNKSLGMKYESGDKVQLWAEDGTLLGEHTFTGDATTFTPSNNSITWTGTKTYYMGMPYTMRYTFSEQVFKQPSGDSKAPSNFTRSQIRNGSIFYNDTRGFKVKVTPDNRSMSEHVFTPTIVGTSAIGALEGISGSFRFPVFTDAEGTSITIESDNSLPVRFSSAEFEMFVHERSRRFG